MVRNKLIMLSSFGMNTFFSFPNPVNEIAARLVASMVLILSITILATGYQWAYALLTYGFLARVLTGPTLSPMGLLATRVLLPLLGNPDRPVPGPPKRFAQTIGLIFSASALTSSLIMNASALPMALVCILAVFAALESLAGFCAGCFVFSCLMRWGLIPKSVCEACMIPDKTLD